MPNDHRQVQEQFVPQIFPAALPFTKTQEQIVPQNFPAALPRNKLFLKISPMPNAQ
ncbi:hypothetical protein H6G33_36420 [Calothrix sp. FACHB-1219]|uniref:hypothetical protein n=1 Tax=unclassified Calothrix TaxID=2619626 RepID=UPI001689EE61|nr:MULTISPECIES: hypothetical protein [unclassified Calothrix]MBD2207849.1 hypothetical protein [Calothrix sp. FACHB-168]MBD2222418.1 hypothetical protein [Calothrix sp. FACHB-1219]